jgi:hypothetical protein
MIKGLQGAGGVTVSGGNVSLPYIPPNANNPIQGMIRVNNTDLEVFNGTGWQSLPSSYATVTLDPETQDLLLWARTQRTLERDRAVLISNNPALENAYRAVLRAEANFDILSKFVEHDEENASVLTGYNFSSSP